jgi:hypothetical protein
VVVKKIIITPCISITSNLELAERSFDGESDMTTSTEDEPQKKEPGKVGETAAYMIEVAAKEEIPPFPPSVGYPHIIYESKLRDWLLTKCTRLAGPFTLITLVINGERTALLRTNTFFTRIEQTRHSLMQSILFNWTNKVQ